MIKYDIKDKKKYITFIILSAFTILIMATLLNDRIHTIVTAVMVLSMVCAAVLLMFSVIKLFSCLNYLKELSNHGYEIPVNKKDYNNSIENLAKVTDTELEESSDLGRNKISLIFAGISFVIYIILFVANIVIKNKYSYFGETIDSLTAIMGVCDFFWILSAFRFFVQSDNRKYKFSDELAINKKNRMSLAGSILYVIIFLGMTLFIKRSLYNMGLYIYRVNENTNLMVKDKIVYSFKEALDNVDEVPEDTLEELHKGVDITTWEDDCEFKHMILVSCEVDSFADLRNEVKNMNGVIQIIVVLDGDTFTVTYDN